MADATDGATNADYLAYDQVDKVQRYHLTEDPDAEQFDDEFEIATCDIGQWLHGDHDAKARFAHELGSALEEIGFAILVGHGIDLELYERCASEVHRVFDRPTADKAAFPAARHEAVNEGWFPMHESTDIHPDQVEGWVQGRRTFALDDPDLDVSQFWPVRTSEAAFRELFLAQEPLIKPIMSAVLTHLGCDPDLYEDQLTDPRFAFRLNWYPPVDEAGAGRLLGHEDINLFTLLPAPASEGLQVLNRANMKWIRLDAPPGSIILNSGDYLQRITNDRIPSTTHRVSWPRDPELRRHTRVSFPMNVYLPPDEVLTCLGGLGPPRYEPVTALAFHTSTTAKFYGDEWAVDS